MTAALALRGLGKDYGGVTAVGAIDLEVQRGECLGLLGPNGAGKTTSMAMACGVLTPTRGIVEIAGIRIDQDPAAAKAKLGFVPQELAIYPDLTGVQNLEYFGALHAMSRARLRERIEWVLEVVGLRDRARDLVKRYSGGMQRRLNLAAGLLHGPEVLVLDEPTVGVDPQSRNHIFETVRALRRDGMAVVYASHYMEEVEALCDRIAIIDHGKIVATGSLAELLSRHSRGGLVLDLRGDEPVVARVAQRLATIGAVTRDGQRIVIDARRDLAAVFAVVEAEPVEIVRVLSQEASLEAVFLSLTGHAMRDAT